MVVVSAKIIIFDPKNGGIVAIHIGNTSITKNSDKSIVAATL
jgi:hypothetical protein